MRGGKKYWWIDTLTVSQTGYNALCQNKFVEEGYKGVGTIYQSKSYVEWIMISISKINATTVVKGMGMIIWFMKKIKGNETNKNHTHRKTTDFLWNY